MQRYTNYKYVAIGNLETQTVACVLALATAVGIYAAIDNPIASVLSRYIQPFVV